MIIDSLQGGSPIIEVVDNFSNNRRLALVLAGKVGKRKMLLATFDLQSELTGRPVARQMLTSLLGYMNSTDFNPPASLILRM